MVQAFALAAGAGLAATCGWALRLCGDRHRHKHYDGGQSDE